MAISFLVNSAWRDAAQLKCTNLADTDDGVGDNTNLPIIVGGPRYHKWTSGSTGDKRIVYVNKNTAPFAADTCFVARADRLVGHGFAVRAFSTYPSVGSTPFTSANWNPTLLGALSQDAIISFGAVSSQQALGVDLSAGAGGNYTKVLSQLFLCTALSFSFNVLSFTRKPLDKFARIQTKHQRVQSYKVQEQGILTLNTLSDADITNLQALYRFYDEPFVIYDPTAKWLVDSLWHCVFGSNPVEKDHDDLHKLTLTVYRLKHYS